MLSINLVISRLRTCFMVLVKKNILIKVQISNLSEDLILYNIILTHTRQEIYLIRINVQQCLQNKGMIIIEWNDLNIFRLFKNENKFLIIFYKIYNFFIYNYIFISSKKLINFKKIKFDFVISKKLFLI